MPAGHQSLDQQTDALVAAGVDATRLYCDKLSGNMRHQQWPDWVSPREPPAVGHQGW